MRKACIAILLLAAACGGDESPPVPNSATPPSTRPVVAGTPSRPSNGWDERAGPVLLVAGERPDEVFLIDPQQRDEADTLPAADFTGNEARLIGRQGVSGTATLADAPSTDEAGCAPWPRLAAPGTTTPWTIGFLQPDIEAVPSESLHGFTSSDSARFVADVARLASTLTGTRRGEHAASFQGLPFVVKDAVRFPGDGGQIAVAHVVRRVNQEANPLEEHTLLILERPEGEARWSIAYSDHSVGHEETVRREELLGVVRLGTQLTLVLALDGGDGVGYTLVQRGAGGRWRQLWQSGRAGC